MRLQLSQLRGLTAFVLGGCLVGTAVLGATLRALPVQAAPVRAAAGPGRAVAGPGRAVAGEAAPVRAAAAGTVVPASADVTGVAFPAPSSGWAIGTGGSGGPAIWHTGDGGTTWQTQWQARGKGKLLSITATDPEHAWVLFGRELLGTTDGGAVWRVLATVPEQAAQVRFGTTRLGVLVVDGCLPSLGLQLSRCPGQVLVSRDGGTSWSRVLTGSMPVFAVADARGQLWAAEPAASGDVAMLTSTDAGRSWSRLGTAKTTYQLSGEVQITLAVSGGRLAWASEYDLGSCAMHGCLTDVLSSGNDGRSWHQVNLPDKYPDDCGPAQLALAVGADGSAWVGLGRNGAACSPPLGLAYRNTGHGWQQLAPWQLDGISSLDPVNAQVAYAIGGLGMLARTADGGQHWTQVLPAAVPGGDLDAVGAGMAFGAQDGDDAGAILRATGTTGWSQVSDLPGTVTEVDFPSAQDGAAISYAPDTTPGWRLWTSMDGGTSWTAGGPLPKGQQLIGPWLTATGQGLLLTDDGGEPWVPQSSGTGPVREWVTSNWGASWRPAGTLQLGKDTPDGPASFSYANGAWTGWISVITASFNTQLDAVSGDRLSKLPGNPPADGMQLVGPGAGFAWTIGYSGHAPVLKLARTTNGGRTWQRSSMTLPANPTAPLPLLGFSSAQDGWLVAGGVTLVTSNGGQTWHRVSWTELA